MAQCGGPTFSSRRRILAPLHDPIDPVRLERNLYENVIYANNVNMFSDAKSCHFKC